MRGREAESSLIRTQFFWNLCKQSASKFFLHFNSQLSGDSVLALKLGTETAGP